MDGTADRMAAGDLWWGGVESTQKPTPPRRGWGLGDRLGALHFPLCDVFPVSHSPVPGDPEAPYLLTPGNREISFQTDVWAVIHRPGQWWLSMAIAVLGGAESTQQRPTMTVENWRNRSLTPR